MKLQELTALAESTADDIAEIQADLGKARQALDDAVVVHTDSLQEKQTFGQVEARRLGISPEQIPLLNHDGVALEKPFRAPTTRR